MLIKSLFLSLLAVSASMTVIGNEQRKAERAEVTSVKGLTHRFEKVHDIVSSYSQGNVKVLKMNQIFLTKLQSLAGKDISDKDIARILDALVYSSIKHQHQTRKDTEQTPYIIHPIGVANHLLTLGNVREADILIGALLHDTVEDTDASFEEIELIFGKRIERIVREVTDDKSLPKMERKRLQIEHAPHKSREAALIKLGDKLYNLNNLLNNPPPDWTKERIDEYFQWAAKVVNGLPPVNSALKNAVDGTIATYWQRNHS